MFFKKLYLYRGGILFGLIILITGISILLSLTEKEDIISQSKISSVKERENVQENGGTHNSVYPRSEYPVSHNREMTSQMREIEKEQSDISRKIVSLESEMSALKEEIQSREDEADNMAFENKGLEERLMEEEEKTMEEIRADMALMENTLYTESEDKEWSDSALKTLNNTFLQDDSQSFTISNVECRSTLCRVDLQCSSAPPEESFRRLQELPLWNGEVFFHMDDINSGEAIMYISREGYSLPQNVPPHIRELL